MPDDAIPEEFWDKHGEHFIAANAVAALLYLIAPDHHDRLSIIGSLAETVLTDIEPDERRAALNFFVRILRDHIKASIEEETEHGGEQELSSGRQPQGAKPVRLDQQGGGAEQPGAGGTGGRGQGKAHEQGGERDLLKADAKRTRKRKVMPAPPLWRVDPKR